MSLSIIQQPQPLALAQSPIVFSVTASANIANPGFQYVAELLIWSGSLTNTGSADAWQLAKYPSATGLSGIFDVSRIINSTQTSLVKANPGDAKWYKIDFWDRWLSGSVYVTGSHVVSSTYVALDGYNTFPQTINPDLVSQNADYATLPILFDGPATQSCFVTNEGMGYAYVSDINGTANTVAKIKYTSDAGTAYYTLTTGSTVESKVSGFPLYPSSYGFPLDKNSITYYTVQAVDSSNNAVYSDRSIRFDLVCKQKYPNVRIAFKNRWGILQYINMDMVNRKSFNTTKRTYQPQLGTWEGSTLGYNEYDSQTLNYVVDANQHISCNTNWLVEEWNEILKQLMVSDEIYWVNEVYDNQPYDRNNWYFRPLTITSQNLSFKTGVNDHLIQYQFEFDYGQGYKMII